jgi:cell division protein FtsB
MAQQDKESRMTLQELLLSSLAQIDALSKLLIEKGIISKEEFLQQISQERTTYQSMVDPTGQ